MVDTGLMGKEERKAPDRIQFEFTDADTLLKEAQETADSIFKKVEGSDDFANPEKAVADTRAFFEKSGVDLTNAAQKAALDKQEALLAKDKKEGAMYALLEFGFGLMAGKSPNALTNVGEAGKAVAPRLFQLQKDIRKGNERLTDARLKLAELENAQKMGIAKVSMERIEKEKERIARANDRLMQTKASFINSFMQNRRMLETSKLSAMTNLQTAQMRVEAQDRATQAQLDKVTRAKLVDDALKLPEPERTERLEEISRAYIRPDPFASLGERLRTAGKGVGLEDKEITALENRLGLTQIK